MESARKTGKEFLQYATGLIVLAAISYFSCDRVAQYPIVFTVCRVFLWINVVLASICFFYAAWGLILMNRLGKTTRRTTRRILRNN